ncbi:MAG: pyrroline-5-carboxylate reductase [Candidatus Hydrogenedentota bacterium]
MAEQLLGTLGFLGLGNMGRAILCGLLEQKTVAPRQVFFYDPHQERQREGLRLGATHKEGPAELAQASDILVLAVKPQQMGEALGQVAPGCHEGLLTISVAAGISTRFIEDRLGSSVHVVRTMPNTPALVNAGATAFALGQGCPASNASVVRTIFQAVGIVEEVAEDRMDAVTSLSGSGPAYFFYMVECLTAAAVAEGLPRDQAARLAGQTLLGAGTLLTQSGENAADLRKRVTSKGGATEAALEQLRQLDLESTVREAVRAAANRSKELGAGE